MGPHSKTDSWGGHRMLSFVRECKSITDNRSLSLLLRLSLALVVASTFAEAMEVKRAGFVGMRGKKASDVETGLMEDMYENEPDLLYESKRQGFVGMRGKKALTDSESDAAEAADLYAVPGLDPDRYFKRAGFVGMRGKKQSDYASNYASYLRRPTLYDAMARNIRAGFVGMRG